MLRHGPGTSVGLESYVRVHAATDLAEVRLARFPRLRTPTSGYVSAALCPRDRSREDCQRRERVVGRVSRVVSQSASGLCDGTGCPARAALR
jgi:hypothetical protein